MLVAIVRRVISVLASSFESLPSAAASDSSGFGPEDAQL
jgi:hypothetical protein